MVRPLTETSPDLSGGGALPVRRPRSSLNLLVGVGVLGSFLLLTVGRHISAPPSVLVLLLVASPFWTLLVALVAALAVLRRPNSGGAWLFLGLQVALWLTIWGRAWWGSPPPVDGDTVRVLSWNVQRLGFEDADDGPKLACVASAVEALLPDVVALMEVSRRDVERLSTRLGLDCEHIDYAGSGRDDRGGVAACARTQTWKLGRSGPRRFVEDSSWYFIFAEMVRADDHQVVNLVSLHLQPNSLSLSGPRSPGAIAQTHSAEATALLERMATLQDPTVVAGDFNSTRETPLHGALRVHLVDAFEQAGWGPGRTVEAVGLVPLRVDYVYTTPDLQPARAAIPALDCSDHRPVVADIVLPEPWDRSR